MDRGEHDRAVATGSAVDEAPPIGRPDISRRRGPDRNRGQERLSSYRTVGGQAADRVAHNHLLTGRHQPPENGTYASGRPSHNARPAGPRGVPPTAG